MANVRLRITELFSKNQACGSYSLFDFSHPLKIYLGTNDEGEKSLRIISRSRRVDVFPSKMINVHYEKHTDDSLLLSFDLLNDRFIEFFYNFCEDVIKNTFSAQESDGFLPVVERYEAWQQFFKRDSSFLSESEIKGLIGELLFIEKYLLPNFGEEKAIKSYIGIEDEHKDFELGDVWHEVKAVHNGANSIKISSLEQLDSSRPGYLEVVVLDEGARSEQAINLNLLVEDLNSMLSSDMRKVLNDKLLTKGYVPNEYYDKFTYLLVAATRYKVDDLFPRLTRESVPNGVMNVKYEISLHAIKDYKESTWI